MQRNKEERAKAELALAVGLSSKKVGRSSVRRVSRVNSIANNSNELEDKVLDVSRLRSRTAKKLLLKRETKSLIWRFLDWFSK